jgi:(1->4)-alpha-D-glucan 1-alpha-D-glucosylmutase
VDPDNRRPVDYQKRRHLLAELDHLTPAAMWARQSEGLPKLWVTRQALKLRPQLAAKYMPLPAPDNIVAYARGPVAVIAPRFALSQAPKSGTVHLPPGTWHNELDGQKQKGGELALSTLFADFPVALLSLL